MPSLVKMYIRYSISSAKNADVSVLTFKPVSQLFKMVLKAAPRDAEEIILVRLYVLQVFN